MSKRIITLGGGMVGSAIARDLKEQKYSVTVADRDESLRVRLAPFGIDYLNLDFSNNNAVTDAVKNFDLVIGAAPGFMGFDNVNSGGVGSYNWEGWTGGWRVFNNELTDAQLNFIYNSGKGRF